MVKAKMSGSTHVMAFLLAAFVGGTTAVESCPQGTRSYINETVNTSATTCELCPAGRYSDQPDSVECTECPMGRVSLPGAVSLETCCAAGTETMARSVLNIFSFSSAADLDFTGGFVYAVNVGGAVTTQSSVEFTNEDVTGVTLTADNHIESWEGRNDFGDDDGLEDVMQSIRWSWYPNPIITKLDYLEVSAWYKLQLLFTEKCCNRGFDILIDDEIIVENFSPQETEGGINSMTTGACVSFSFISQRSTMVITLVGNGGFKDDNPILHGFTLAKQSSAGMLDMCTH